MASAWIATCTVTADAPSGTVTVSRPSRPTRTAVVRPPVVTAAVAPGRYAGGVVTVAVPDPFRVNPSRPAAVSALNSCAAVRAKDTDQPHCRQVRSIDV